MYSVEKYVKADFYSLIYLLDVNLDNNAIRSIISGEMYVSPKQIILAPYTILMISPISALDDRLIIQRLLEIEV